MGLVVGWHGLEAVAEGGVLQVMLEEGGVGGWTARLREHRRRRRVAVPALQRGEVEGVGCGEEGGVGGGELVVGMIEGHHVQREARFAGAMCWGVRHT